MTNAELKLEIEATRGPGYWVFVQGTAKPGWWRRFWAWAILGMAWRNYKAGGSVW